MALFYLGFLLGVPLGILLASLLVMAGEKGPECKNVCPSLNSPKDLETTT